MGMWRNSGRSHGTATVLDGSPAISALFAGSVSGRLDVPHGVTVHIHGVLEDALVTGRGTVRVCGLIAGVFTCCGGTLLARPGSVVVPEYDAGPWLVLQAGGTWAESAGPVFPTAADTPAAALPDSADWWPVPFG